MEFLLATQELREMNYPADTVEVALVYTNTEKAKVWVCFYSLFFFYCVQTFSRFITFEFRVVESSGQLLKHFQLQ